MSIVVATLAGAGLVSLSRAPCAPGSAPARRRLQRGERMFEQGRAPDRDGRDGSASINRRPGRRSW
jgi:hypothetical protein